MKKALRMAAFGAALLIGGATLAQAQADGADGGGRGEGIDPALAAASCAHCSSKTSGSRNVPRPVHHTGYYQSKG